MDAPHQAEGPGPPPAGGAWARPLRAVVGLMLLLAFSEAGELAQRGGMALPGPVIGLVLLAAAVVLLDRAGLGGFKRTISRPSRHLIRHMGLLFVPAGVGVMTQSELIARTWAPLAAGLVGSTLGALVVTGWLMQRLGRARGDRPVVRAR